MSASSKPPPEDPMDKLRVSLIRAEKTRESGYDIVNFIRKKSPAERLNGVRLNESGKASRLGCSTARAPPCHGRQFIAPDDTTIGRSDAIRLGVIPRPFARPAAGIDVRRC